MGKTNHSHPGVINMDKESHRCYILSLNIYGFHQQSNTDSDCWVSSPAIHIGPFQPSGKTGIIMAYTTNFHMQWRNGLNTSSGFVFS